MKELSGLTVLVRGGGEVGSAVAHRLHGCRCRVCLTEIARPLAVSRGTCFSEAIYDAAKTIEGVTAELTAASPGEVKRIWQKGNIPIAIDPGAALRELLVPDVLVDAMMLKGETSTRITDAPQVIGIGPGFSAGRDVHLVVESGNSPNLGRVIERGEAEKNTGIPLEIGGISGERVIWAPGAGIFTTHKNIGDTVTAGEAVGMLGDLPLEAPLSGMLRGLLRRETHVSAGAKLVEIDPLNDMSVCFVIRARMRTIAGGVLEAIMLGLSRPTP